MEVHMTKFIRREANKMRCEESSVPVVYGTNVTVFPIQSRITLTTDKMQRLISFDVQNDW